MEIPGGFRIRDRQRIRRTDSGTGNLVKGILHFAEQIEGEETFIVKQEVSGHIEGNKINLKSIPAKYYSVMKISSMNLTAGKVKLCRMVKLPGTVRIPKEQEVLLLWNGKVIKTRI